MLLTAGGAGAEKCLTTFVAVDESPIRMVLSCRRKIVPASPCRCITGNIKIRRSSKLIALIESGPFDIEVAKTFSLEQVADAQRALDDHYLGKLAITLN